MRFNRRYFAVGALAAPFLVGRAAFASEAHFYQLIREVLIANLHNHAANVCIEVGRQNTPHGVRPTFTELEEALKAVKQESA